MLQAKTFLNGDRLDIDNNQESNKDKKFSCRYFCSSAARALSFRPQYT